MGEKTNISWTDSTVNFWSGCTKVSAGCQNCYAEALSNRFAGEYDLTAGQLAEPRLGMWGKGAPRKLHESAFKLALRLNKRPWVCDCGVVAYPAEAHEKYMLACPKCHSGYHRRRIFSLSLGDWLDPEVPVEWLAMMLDTIHRCSNVTWILVTKRPELWTPRMERVVSYLGVGSDTNNWLVRWLSDAEIPPHVWLLASVENQEMADKRVPELLKIPAAVHGLSLEPLLGPVDLGAVPGGLCSPIYQDRRCKLSWLVLGGESGPKARPCNLAWIRSLVQQGKAAGCKTFVKQLGSFCVEEHGSRRTRILHDDSKGAYQSEWPEDLRVREFPRKP